MAFRSFVPPQRLLLGPGPSPVPARVLRALAGPTVGHLDPAFVELMDQIQQLLRYAFRTRNRLTLPVSAPGSAGMESAFVNLLEPGDLAVVCVNGVFGERMAENARRCGARVVRVDQPWGRAVSPQALDQALTDNPQARVAAFVHAETSTGVLSDAAELCRIIRDHGCLSVVDAVTSLGGVPLLVDDWGADFVYSGSQKCLSCVPGLSPITLSEGAVARIRQRQRPVQSWFLDLSLVMAYWGAEQRRAYHHTAPVNALYALHESLVMLREQGLESAWERHRIAHQGLRAGLDALGLQLLVEPACRLPQLNAVCVPDGIDEAALRRRMLEHHGIEIGAGLGELAGRIWRIGLMGEGARAENVLRCLEALEECLITLGRDGERGRATAAAERLLAA